MREEKIFHSNSVTATEGIGERFAEELLNDGSLPRFIALYGDLGVGKTAFVRGFTSKIAPNARVKSPTFALVNEYGAKDMSVFHFDMYRITDEDDLYSIGFYDYPDRGGICLTEWSENIIEFLPQDCVRVNIEKDDPDNTDHRRITISFCKESVQ